LINQSKMLSAAGIWLHIDPSPAAGGEHAAARSTLATAAMPLRRISPGRFGRAGEAMWLKFCNARFIVAAKRSLRTSNDREFGSHQEPGEGRGDHSIGMKNLDADRSTDVLWRADEEPPDDTFTSGRHPATACVTGDSRCTGLVYHLGQTC
jgi:hypothetical protein